MILVDTNVLVDVIQSDPAWGDWSLQQLRRQAQLHALIVNPVIYAELSVMYESPEALDTGLAKAELRMHELPRAALFLAAKAFALYRRQGGAKQNVLADFFIGAHAVVAGCPILTRDTCRYRTYFPTVDLIAPEKSPGFAVHGP